MGAIAFDPLEYTHDLEAVGVPRKQAEIHARAMTDRFIHNFESLPRFIGYALVTTDYLDSRFAESEARVDKRFTESEARVDKRFAQVDVHFVELEARVDTHFTETEARLNAKIDTLSADIAIRFERMDGKFSRIYLMFGLTMVTATIPILQNFFGA